jgi:hypothetical protein
MGKIKISMGFLFTGMSQTWFCNYKTTCINLLILNQAEWANRSARLIFGNDVEID